MLREYFEGHKTGPGIWKWLHYFEIYERHFEKFRGHDVHLLEIGVYSGGSLQMWREYFGDRAAIYGVDIEPACKRYQTEAISIFVGDQGRREFWRDFRKIAPMLDIVIDDGGHLAEQQIVSFEELLPHLRPGGVYCCEDIHGYPGNGFGDYILRYASGLNDHRGADNKRSIKRATQMQADIHSVHLYPYVAVIEKNVAAVDEFVAPKRGSEWQTFLK